MGLRILIVEDHDSVREALGRQLARRGFKVLLAPDGRRGLSMATLLQPDAIVMDLGMPEMDGWTAIQTLKSSNSTKDIPIVVLSGYFLDGDQERAIASGAAAFESKPVNLDRLTETIQRIAAAVSSS